MVGVENPRSRSKGDETLSKTGIVSLLEVMAIFFSNVRGSFENAMR
jgi:hypothetical protein